MTTTATEDPAEYVRALAADASFRDEFGILRAMVRCLSPVEAVRLLQQEAGSSSRLRDALLPKVVEDMRAKCLREHRALARRLTSSLPTADARTNQVVAFTLGRVAEVAPRVVRHQIHQSLLGSRYIALRRRGYKHVGRDSLPNVAAALAAWKAFEDPEGAWLLVRILPAADLVSMRSELLPALTEGWHLSRLYMRIADQVPDVLDELRLQDGISYCYACAKLGRIVSVEVAGEIVDKYAGDERLGLLVWSLGRMELWDVLKWVKERLPELEEKRMAAFMSRIAP